MGLALVAAVRGYKCFHDTDKHQEKSISESAWREVMSALPVERKIRRSYYSVAKKLAREIHSYTRNVRTSQQSEAHYGTTVRDFSHRIVAARIFRLTR